MSKKQTVAEGEQRAHLTPVHLHLSNLNGASLESFNVENLANSSLDE
jgi:hypothetical protein